MPYHSNTSSSQKNSFGLWNFNWIIINFDVESIDTKIRCWLIWIDQSLSIEDDFFFVFIDIFVHLNKRIQKQMNLKKRLAPYFFLPFLKWRNRNKKNDWSDYTRCSEKRRNEWQCQSFSTWFINDDDEDESKKSDRRASIVQCNRNAIYPSIHSFIDSIGSCIQCVKWGRESSLVSYLAIHLS